tara:strand:- start:8 stop:892 length:885 start_codon:yes stop_codon:yes gene_type:complete
MIKNKKKLTIGIPTFKRNKYLIKSLNCLKNQTFRKFDLYVSNNSTDRNDIDKINNIKKKFQKEKFYFTIFHQKKNIRAIKNLFFLLKKSKSKYFLWLSDDDELSPESIKIMIEDLEKNKDVVTMVPYWAHFIAPKNYKLIKPYFSDSRFTIIRVIKFLYKGDDAFFYGLHKANILKKCKYFKFWNINKSILNWAYPFIFQLILKGKIKLVRNKKAIWYNREYTLKHTLPKKNKKNNNNINFFYKKILKYLNLIYLYNKIIYINKKYIILLIFLINLPILLSFKTLNFIMKHFKI